MNKTIIAIDRALTEKCLITSQRTQHYALPQETKYDDYEERYREYFTPRKIMFTVLIRKSKNGYWVRCGYKEDMHTKYVNGMPGRDITTDNETEIVSHCLKCLSDIVEDT